MDHRLTYSSVQISLIDIFLARDLDFLCAVSTPPYNSWKNPAERIMSILNIGLQSVGIMRNKTCSYEDSLKNLNTLSDIRSLGQKEPALKEEVKDALEPMKALLHGLFSRLKIKGKSFRTFEAASVADMNKMWQCILDVDGDLKPEVTHKKELDKLKLYQAFLSEHCKITHYMFSVKKCTREVCICKPPTLPTEVFDTIHHLPDPVPNGEHFKPFEELYGKVETTDVYRQSLKENEAKSSGMPFPPSAQSAKNTKTVIQCHECDK